MNNKNIYLNHTHARRRTTYIALGLGLKSVGHEVTIATLKEFDDLVTELCTVCNTLKQPHPSACRIG